MSQHDNNYPDRFEVLDGMDGFVAENLGFLAPTASIWQPTDYLPDLTAENWRERMEDFRAPAQSLSDEILVVLVGDMVTEEALPNYALALNHIARDNDGNAQTPWAKWLRGWTAEENRHGDLLNAYLRLTGRVDMRAIEVTVQNLIVAGFNPQTSTDPYKGLIYTSFQERATRISHGNVARLAASAGDANLGKICQRIAGDESRHESFYTKVMGRVLDLDPTGGVLAFKDMMRTVIAMPGRFMHDGKDADLFDHFSIIAQRTNTYTVHDYAAIIDHLVKTWDIAGRKVRAEAARAQTYLCRQAERYLSFADEISAGLEKQIKIPFSWIHGRSV